MSDFDNFKRSPILRHWSTWVVGLLGCLLGGIEMYGIREAKRAAGDELQFPSLWIERTVDFVFGAGCQLVIFLCAIWIVVTLLMHHNVWIRQATVVFLYIALVLLMRIF